MFTGPGLANRLLSVGPNKSQEIKKQGWDFEENISSLFAEKWRGLGKGKGSEDL